MNLSLKAGLTHGSCVDVNGSGILIVGRAGAGKSALALALIGLGATLVADDQVLLSNGPGGMVAQSKEPLQGLIEARKIGLLHANYLAESVVRLVIDLDHEEPDRLPSRRKVTLGEHEVDLILGRETPNLAVAAWLYVSHGRRH